MEDFVYLLVIQLSRAAWFVLGLMTAIGLGVGTVWVVTHIGRKERR